MDAATLAGPLIALVGTVATAGVALWSSVLLRRSEKARQAAELEAAARKADADRLQAERDRLDVRTERMLDEYQEEIARLRGILANREQGCAG